MSRAGPPAIRSWIASTAVTPSSQRGIRPHGVLGGALDEQDEAALPGAVERAANGHRVTRVPQRRHEQPERPVVDSLSPRAMASGPIAEVARRLDDALTGLRLDREPIGAADDPGDERDIDAHGASDVAQPRRPGRLSHGTRRAAAGLPPGWRWTRDRPCA